MVKQHDMPDKKNNLNEIVLVTGGSGFAGSHLLEALISAGYTQLHATHFGAQRIPQFTQPVEFHQVDLTQREATENLITKIQPTQIYHLASFAAVGQSFARAEQLMTNNTVLQLNILEAVRKITPQAKILTIGSAEEYGILPKELQNHKIKEDFPFHPANPYAVSKVTQELLTQTYTLAFKLNTVRVRPFNHIGERQAIDFVIPNFVSQIVKIEKGQQEKLFVGSLEAVRDFTDVKDMVRAYITLMQAGITGEVYNVGSSQGWKISEILDTLLGMAQQKITVEQDVNRLRPSDVPFFVADSSKITQLGWKPQILLTDTLARIMQEWRTKI